MERLRRVCAVNYCFTVLFLCIPFAINTPLDAQNASTTAAPAMEVEVVTIGDFSASPYAIKPKHGPFVLILLNESRISLADLVLDSPNVAADQLSTLATSMRLSSFRNVRRLQALINLPPGIYQLKRKTTGELRLTITIE